jgi:aspartyl-tRNA(Asn)/glutamyl-tRNA(Gln) amidotransferase subunit A
MDTTEVTGLTLAAVSEAIRRRELTSVEVTEACLARIDELNPSLNAFITVTAESALREAGQADDEISGGGWRGPLHGVPLALKDLCDTAGVRTTAGSAVYLDRVPEEDAEVVRRLRSAGAVLLGKLNLHEFAYGGTSHVSHFGPPRNPCNPEHIAGGSSGGSSAAVATGMCYGALGTDTGGSIRQPSALCGIVGLKATHGRVSIRGIVPLSWSLDHVGPMTRTVEDAAIMLDVLAGYDPADPVSIDRPVDDYAAAVRSEVAQLRIGVPRQLFYDGLHPEVEAIVNGALEQLSGVVASVEEVSLPISDTESMRAISGRVLQAEAYAYHRQLVESKADRYDPDTLTRIRRGAEISAADYIEARRRLVLLRREILKTFAQVDVLVTPTTPVPAPRFDELGDDIGIATLRNTSPFNAYGLPTISIPAGVTSDGLPVGIQISAAPFAETTVIALAHRFEADADVQQRALVAAT